MSYCARIDDIDVGGFVEVALHKASSVHLLTDQLAICLIDLAAQRGDGEGTCCGSDSFGCCQWFLLLVSVY